MHPYRVLPNEQNKRTELQKHDSMYPPFSKF